MFDTFQKKCRDAAKYMAWQLSRLDPHLAILKTPYFAIKNFSNALFRRKLPNGEEVEFIIVKPIEKKISNVKPLKTINGKFTLVISDENEEHEDYVSTHRDEGLPPPMD